MCAILKQPERASTVELQEAIQRKIEKFKGLLNMPKETRKLVEAGMRELDRRHA
jgi:hypothetical protein